MSYSIYKKEFQKNIFIGLIPAGIMVGLTIIMGAFFPEFKKQADSMNQLMQETPMYAALLGEDVVKIGIGSFEGFFGMEMFTMLDLIFLILAVFLGAGIIAREVDKKTLDITLSYPIPRWQFITSKFSVYYSYVFFIFIFGAPTMSLTAIILGEDINHFGLILGFMAKMVLYFTLSAISLLCGAIFLRPKLAYSTAGGSIVGLYLVRAIFGLVESTKAVQNLSPFNYLDATMIWVNGSIPLDELFIVLSVGIIALISALYIFNKKELTY